MQLYDTVAAQEQADTSQEGKLDSRRLGKDQAIVYPVISLF